MELSVPSSSRTARAQSAREARDRDRDDSDSGTSGGCLSQPSSPRLSGRLGRVTRLISRSDANLANVHKGKRTRHDSGDSGSNVHSLSNTPEDGSPSKASSLMAKATGYMTHLKSRIGKHRERVRDEREKEKVAKEREQQSQLQAFGACCGHKRQPESTDTIAGGPGTSSVPSMVDSAGSAAEGSASISVNVSSTTNSEFCDESVIQNYQVRNSDYPQDTSSKQRKESLPPTQSSSQSAAGSSAPSGSTMPSSQFPFHTMNVHLQRGKNLVAKDACGSSDPYVKVKIGDKLHYKSKTIYRDLNPIWDESFVLPISDPSQLIIFKVFDYDWGFQDDFMGMASLDVSRLPPNKATEITLTLTETNTPGSDSMGDIFLTVTLVPRTIEEKEIWFSDGQAGTARLADSQRRLKSQIWSSVLTCLLLEAKNLSPGEDRVYMDAFVKFRLGNQKYKTRTLSRTTAPKWIEQFDFYLYEGQPQILEVQIFDESFSREYIGRCSIDIGLLEKETTHHKTIPLQESPGEISFLLTISGTSGAESISDLTNYNPSPEEENALRSRFALRRSLQNIPDVGLLTVKVFEAQGLAAADIGGKSDPFCVLELVNSRLQTQTEYRTLTPVWNKIFTFDVKDMTEILEITVYDEDKNHKQEFLGKLNLPLYKIKNGEKKWYMLKDRKLLRMAAGSNPQILLEMTLKWNPIRAGLRVMDPPEQKFLVQDQRLKRETFLLNLDRLKKIAVTIYDVMQYTQSCVEWEYPLRSVIAFVVYQVFVYTFQPFFIPLILMILILRQWLYSSITGAPLQEDLPDDETLIIDDDDDEGEGEEKKLSLRQKLQAVQDATQTVQNALGDIASICESTRNTFRMVVPFISWLAVLALFIGTIVLYFIPLRYLCMAWGFHRFMRPILRPNVVPTNEVYNLLLRVPDNQQLQLYKPVRQTAPPSDPQRSRSPPGKVPGKETKKKYKFW